ncbi:MAG TPA: nitronate monooxygenase [Thermoleophilaceae bacterium]|jgi:nitronate monooxygenase|nr:nitronate monooxygenase [Thermoleophilaceae bacterium]
MILDELDVPIVLAPLAGGPSTPELAAVVSNAGGLGFLGAGYLTPDALGERITQTRALSRRPFGVNLFVITGSPADPATYSDYVEALGPEAGQPQFDDDEFGAKLALLADDPVAVVSFTFGLPPAAAIERLRTAGSEIWITVTSPDEAAQGAAAGADLLVVQGAEAGGHRGSFDDAADQPLIPLLELLSAVRAITDVPLVAAGGIATAEGVAAALEAGATAAAVGTAFMLAPEAGTSQAHRAALASDTPTALTRAFTGRLARGIRNRFMNEHPDAPRAYPEIHYATAPIRAAARKAGDAELINLWAGEAHQLTEARPAAEIVRMLSPGR